MPPVLNGVRRLALALPGRGVEIAALDWGGEGPLALMHHANGFCAATWAPVAERIRRRFRVVAIDARGHGDSSKPEGPEAYSWLLFLEDLVSIAERLTSDLGYERVSLAAGNSFGGTLSACAAAVRPKLFERVVMLDPVVRPSEEMLRSLELDFPAARRRGDIVEMARRRRGVWPSRAEALESYRTKNTFAHWDPRALDLYVEEGMRDRADGQVELKCPPEIEASVYTMNQTVDLFAYAPRVRAPTLVAAAEAGHFPRVLFERLVEELPEGRLVSLKGGHLLPMEDPDATAELLIEFGAEAR